VAEVDLGVTDDARQGGGEVGLDLIEGGRSRCHGGHSTKGAVPWVKDGSVEEQPKPPDHQADSVLVSD
jgi:hypothetical protein